MTIIGYVVDHESSVYDEKSHYSKSEPVLVQEIVVEADDSSEKSSEPLIVTGIIDDDDASQSESKDGSENSSNSNF
jgi:hypothetical protein